MNWLRERELYEICDLLWKKVRRRMGHVTLPEHDWEDIRAVSITRVFARFHQYDQQRGKMHGWILTILLNSTYNELRRFLPDKKVPSHKWRTNLRFARPLLTVFRQANAYGDFEISVEPDIVDDRTFPAERKKEIEEVRTYLTAKENKLLDSLFDGQSISSIYETTRDKNYQVTHKRVNDLFRKCRQINEAHRPL